MSNFAGGVIVVLLLIFNVWLYFFVPASMATERGRSPVAWVIVGLLLTPFAAIIALVFLGGTPGTPPSGLRKS
ncbi:hypothetical protein IQ03_04829 [Gemmobacter caeni]|uniref:Uncharacterized protein n=1 Tax=Gemmobacter caeni TaxID=589035 RepID=A0A2T6AZ89_9RHOB|nr:hypothetical protein [Gemmobacter caeni]PTX49132.1 hypothetical protein C8N34_108243 [Gemmobacter caeni]TWI93469.1 hypothetical protein IQ03_04829 [Gemmobacter caeni]